MATLTISGAIAMASGQRSINLTVTESPTDVGMVATVALQTGDNAVALPASSLGTVAGCIVVPVGVAGGTTLTWRTVNGDTGISLSGSNPSVLCFNANSIPASVIFHSSATAGELEVSFF
jgi:hypothetical protein